MKSHTYADSALKIRVTACIRQIESQHFDATTVRSLYMLLRPTATDTLTGEIADFFAHPKRDKGKTHATVLRLIKLTQEALSGKPVASPPEAVTNHEIIDDLNRAITKVGLPPIRDTFVHSVAIVLFAALQGSSFEVPGDVIPVGFYVVNEHLVIVGFQVEIQGKRPVIRIFTMPNVFGMPTFLPDIAIPGMSHLVVEFRRGALHFYQTHDPVIVKFPERPGQK